MLEDLAEASAWLIWLIIGWPLAWWRATQREIDLEILWPSCKEQAYDLEHAKAAFAIHAFNDEAWLCLGEAEIARRIDELQ